MQVLLKKPSEILPGRVVVWCEENIAFDASGAVSGEYGEKTKRLKCSPYSTRLDYLTLTVDGSAPKTGHWVVIPRNLK